MGVFTLTMLTSRKFPINNIELLLSPLDDAPKIIIARFDWVYSRDPADKFKCELCSRQVRASLETLRKDKLIKSITKGEKEELGPGGGALKFNHYFIRSVTESHVSSI